MKYLKLFENYLDKKYSKPQYLIAEYTRDYHKNGKIEDFSESNFKKLKSLNWKSSYSMN